LPEHPEKDWNLQAIYHPVRGTKWLCPRLDNSSQGGSDPGNDSRAAPSRDLGAAENDASASPQPLAVTKTQSTVRLVGPRDTPQEDFSGRELQESAQFVTHRSGDSFTCRVY